MFLRISLVSKEHIWSLTLIKLQAWFPITLLKRDSNTNVFCETCEILRIYFFYWTPVVATSAFIRLTHALWIKLICRNLGTSNFPVNFAKFLKTLLTTSGCCFFLSQDTKYQNALLQLHAKGLSFDSKYSQSGNRFPLIIEAYLELSQKSTVVDWYSSK